jgi:hypothetical protein
MLRQENDFATAAARSHVRKNLIALGRGQQLLCH